LYSVVNSPLNIYQSLFVFGNKQPEITTLQCTQNTTTSVHIITTLVASSLTRRTVNVINHVPLYHSQFTYANNLGYT